MLVVTVQRSTLPLVNSVSKIVDGSQELLTVAEELRELLSYYRTAGAHPEREAL